MKLSQKIDIEDYIRLNGDARNVEAAEKIAVFGYSGSENCSSDPRDCYRMSLHQWGL